MKKFTSIVLAGALAVSLAVPALAADGRPLLIATQDIKVNTITVNGTKLDTAKLPVAAGIPMRAFVEADGGEATWFAEENSSLFSIDGTSVMVKFETGEVTVDGKTLTDTKAVAVEGVTFVPVEAVKAMSGVTVAESDGIYAITTPSADPLVKLAKSIQTETEMGNGMKVKPEELELFVGLNAKNYESIVAYTPMMINADTVIIGKVAAGKMADAKKELETYRARIQQGFEQYLPGPLEMAKNGKIVSNGDYVMLIISPDTAKATELFNSAVKGL